MATSLQQRIALLVEAQGTREAGKKIHGVSDEVDRVGDHAKTASRKVHGLQDRFKRLGSAGGGLKKLTGGFGGLLATLGGGALVGNAIKGTQDLGSSTIGLMKAFGLSEDNATKWAVQAKVRGINSKQLATSFTTLSKQIDAARTGTKSSITLFDRLGISQKDLKDRSGDLQSTIALVSDKLSQQPNALKRAVAGQKLFGKGWQSLRPLLADGSSALDEQLKLADKYHVTFGGKVVKTVGDLNSAQRESKIATLGLNLAIGTQLAPILTTLIGKVTDLFGWLRKNKGVLVPLAKIILGVVVATKAWSLATSVLSKVWKLSPLGKVILLLTAIGAGLVLLWKKSETFRDIVKGAFSVVKTVIGGVAAVAKGMWKAIEWAVGKAKDGILLLLTPIQVVVDAWNAMNDLIHPGSWHGTQVGGFDTRFGSAQPDVTGGDDKFRGAGFANQNAMFSPLETPLTLAKGGGLGDLHLTIQPVYDGKLGARSVHRIELQELLKGATA